MTQTLTSAPPLTRAAVTELAASDPAWLRAARLAAFDTYDGLAVPTDRTRGWRRLMLDGLALTPASLDAERIGVRVAGEDDRRGVIAIPLVEAAKSHADVLRPLLESTAPAVSLAKYAALAAAGWRAGAFVYVPDGVHAAQAITVQSSLGSFQRVVVVLGAGASATVLEVHDESEAFVTGATDLAVGEGARLKYAHVQSCGPDSVTFSRQHARVGRDGRLVTLNFGIGGKLAKTDVEVELIGAGAESEMLGLVFGEREQQFDYHTLQGHRAHDTRSDLLFKSALDDRAHGLYTGVIIIERGAQRSDAYQANRNLLLAEGARADTEPMLEIEADDVRCTHGATVGPIDDEQMFYCRSRGLDADAAARLIVDGFFREVVEKFSDEYIAQQLERWVAPHLGRVGSR